MMTPATNSDLPEKSQSLRTTHEQRIATRQQTMRMTIAFISLLIFAAGTGWALFSGKLELQMAALTSITGLVGTVTAFYFANKDN